MPNVKGSNVLAAVKMLRANRDRALALLSREHHHYLSERILPSTWYPEADQHALLRAVGALLPKDPDPFVMMGRIAARDDLASLYKFMVKTGDLPDTLRAASSLWQTFHDTGELKIKIEAPTQAIATVRGYGAPTREMCRTVGGYVSEIVAAAGAKQVAASKLSCVLDGAQECSWRVRWS
jgi:hypothetical protein